MLALIKLLPESLRYKALFRMGISVVPMIRYLRPRLVEVSPERAVIRINLSRRSKNAYNSLFIVLAQLVNLPLNQKRFP